MIPCESTGDFVRRIASEPRGPGRPPTGTPIHIRVDPDVLARIDAAAVEQETTRAVIVRQILANGVEPRPRSINELVTNAAAELLAPAVPAKGRRAKAANDPVVPCDVDR